MKEYKKDFLGNLVERDSITDREVNVTNQLNTSDFLEFIKIPNGENLTGRRDLLGNVSLEYTQFIPSQDSTFDSNEFVKPKLPQIHDSFYNDLTWRESYAMERSSSSSLYERHIGTFTQREATETPTKKCSHCNGTGTKSSFKQNPVGIIFLNYRHTRFGRNN